jgi:hypothetical protein
VSSDPFYYSRIWRKFRAEYLKRHPICAVAGCGKLATNLDHKIRRPIGPDFPPDDGLDGLCQEHHSRKTRVHDQTGKTGEYKHKMQGCDANGMPLDTANHHWHKR